MPYENKYDRAVVVGVFDPPGKATILKSPKLTHNWAGVFNSWASAYTIYSYLKGLDHTTYQSLKQSLSKQNLRILGNDYNRYILVNSWKDIRHWGWNVTADECVKEFKKWKTRKTPGKVFRVIL